MALNIIPCNDVNVFIPPAPYKLRTNCKMGMFGSGDTNNFENAKLNGRGKWLEGVVVDTKGFHGDLGMTLASDWLQVWVLITNSELNEKGKPYLAPGLLVVTMLKKESADNLSKIATDLEISAILDGTGAEGFAKIFRFEFTPRSGQYGDYYALVVKYRDPESDAEKSYTQAAQVIFNTMPDALVDNETTKNMTPKLLGGNEVPALPAAEPQTQKQLAGSKK